MKNPLKFIVFISLIIISISIYFYLKIDRNIKKVVKEVKTNSKNLLSLKIKTIEYSKNRGYEHFTNINNTLFYNKRLDIKITKGGIIKKDIVNTFFNPNYFKGITIYKNNIYIGYQKGFLMLSKDNINFFDLSIDIKKCIKKDKLYCISDNMLIFSKTLSKFYKKRVYKSKIKDITIYNDKILLLFGKSIVIVGESKERRVELNSNFNKFIKNNDKLYLSSDRAIYQFKDEKVNLIKNITGINNIIEFNNEIYYISFDGIIYKNDKKIVKINTIINYSSLIDEKIYLFTENGVYFKYQDEDISKEKEIENILQQNFITKFYKNNNKIFIGFFNKGVSYYNLLTKEITPFVTDLNGVNDFAIFKDTIYIATTNALDLFDSSANKIGSFSKKDGLLGRNVSSIEKLDESIYFGTEGGVSKKVNSSFISVYGLNGLINNRVNCMKRYKNHLYVGTLGGISKLKGLKIVKNFGLRYFKTVWITSLNVVSNLLFIGTYGAGLYFYDGKKIERISKKKIYINPNAIVGDKDFVFVGTLNSGILIYDIKNRREYLYDKLSSLNITALHIEGNNLFVGSDFGFWIMPINDLK